MENVDTLLDNERVLHVSIEACKSVLEQFNGYEAEIYVRYIISSLLDLTAELGLTTEIDCGIFNSIKLKDIDIPARLSINLSINESSYAISIPLENGLIKYDESIITDSLSQHQEKIDMLMNFKLHQTEFLQLIKAKEIAEANLSKSIQALEQFKTKYNLSSNTFTNKYPWNECI